MKVIVNMKTQRWKVKLTPKMKFQRFLRALAYTFEYSGVMIAYIICRLIFSKQFEAQAELCAGLYCMFATVWTVQYIIWNRIKANMHFKALREAGEELFETMRKMAEMEEKIQHQSQWN